MSTYTLAEVSRITDMPKSTIQKYYPTEPGSDQFHKNRRKFTDEDIKNLFYIKINLCVGNKNAFIKKSLSNSDTEKRRLLKNAIDDLQKTINLVSLYCYNDEGESIVRNQIQRFGFLNSKELSNITFDLFKNNVIEFRDDIAEKMDIFCDELFKLIKERKDISAIDNTIKNISTYLLERGVSDYGIKSYLENLFPFMMSELEEKDYKNLSNYLENYFKNFRDTNKLFSDKFNSLCFLIYDNDCDSLVVQESFKDLFAFFYKMGLTNKSSYSFISKIIEYAYKDATNNENVQYCEKIKKANEIFQQNIKSKKCISKKDSSKKIIVNIDDNEYDIGFLHSIIYKLPNKEKLKESLEAITSDADIEYILNDDYKYDFSLLRKEMEERYYLINRNKCKYWYSPKICNQIKPKIVVIDMDVINKSDYLDISILFQSSPGSGIYLIVGYSDMKKKSQYGLFESSALRINKLI